MKTQLLLILFVGFCNTISSMGIEDEFGFRKSNISPQRFAMLPIQRRTNGTQMPQIPMALRIQQAWQQEREELEMMQRERTLGNSR